ncbi:MAG: zinc ABC transporter solute-binding protein [Deltaproteobacteria bacterium]|nr:zinc ABC transporter solute-binding protein [Deltaproteobacteria bacterium]
MIIILAFLGVACGEKREKPAKPMVVVSVVPQAYFVKRIAGNLIDVKVMIPPGASPTTYEPTMEQMLALAKASLYIKVGHPSFPFEKAWLEKLLRQGRRLKVVDCSKGLELLDDDPHIWLSPKRARAIAGSIAAAVKSLIPRMSDSIDANYRQLLADIDALDGTFREALSKVKIRRFYVFHPAWGYLASEYGLEQVAIEKGHKEPSPGDLRKIVSSAQSDGVRVVFAEPQLSTESAGLIARELGGEVVIIDPLPGDWLDGMRKTAAALKEALSP